MVLYLGSPSPCYSPSSSISTSLIASFAVVGLAPSPSPGLKVAPLRVGMVPVVALAVVALTVVALIIVALIDRGWGRIEGLCSGNASMLQLRKN